ncbi:transglycosylase domain-containing protein [Paenibacillus tarimensis]|uniref:transglycosylase domain-containing protein n=1 Tax=Paenibacillus tarimensis TaxID=416012 RepID=UPI001F196D44|nr:transglycosylase domain-containing protein [Paenibacillus tarimensis]MCF2944070.1 transglycosylase domain-containing protein [Paenibacillus tarimensis]
MLHTTYVKEHAKAGNKHAARGKQRGIYRLYKVPVLLMALVLLLLAVWHSVLAVGGRLTEEQKLNAVLNGEHYISINEMPDYVWQAFIAVEDNRFMSHHGVDPRALGRALAEDIKAGGFVEGGSTITMQLARNLFLTHDKTVLRKIKETAIALHLERSYTKEQILSMYLNQIYFGHGKYGIEEAANLYFGKTVRAGDPDRETIRLEEAAMLAALPKAPENYSPLRNPEKAYERRQLVLELMEQHGVITAEEQMEANSRELAVNVTG